MELILIKKWLSQLKELEFEKDDRKEIVQRLLAEEDDFEEASYRFIAESSIDKILEEELQSDLYILGCFRADFVSRITNLPVEMIEACQKAEAYEAVGKGILATCGISVLAKAYVEADSYSHHFAHYDGETNEIEGYYVFKVN